nr:uncharacterized protein C6orf15 homolog [Cavia porcellus]
MPGRTVGSWAPLGLLLVCLHLPGLFARSISAAEEKVASSPWASLPAPGQPPLASPSGAGLAQPHADPEAQDVSGLPSKFQAAGRSGRQVWPLSWGLPPSESWPLEFPWQMVAPAAEDLRGQALPEALAYLSNAGALPPVSGSWPAEFSTKAAQPSPEALPAHLDSSAQRLSLASPLGVPGNLAQRPFWSLIYRLLPHLPWGALNPNVPWGGGLLGTGWGTRPMPYPSGAWGINSQFPGGNWGSISRYPGGRWGTSWYPEASGWGTTNRYPVSSWGSNSRYPGAGRGNTAPGVVRPPGPSWYLPAGLSNPPNPGLQ